MTPIRRMTMTSGSISLLLRLLAAAFSTLVLLEPLAACAQAQAPSETDRRAEKKAVAPAAGLSAELMYRLLVGDIAFQRGEPGLAARAYLEAARDVRDVRVARRA